MHRRLLPLTAVAAGLVLAGPVLASHVQPQLVDGASSCGPLTPGTVELIVEVPQELAGTVTDDDFSAAVTLDGSVGNGSVRFEDATLPVKGVFVAGVSGGNLYAYEEPVREDEGLVAPDGEPIAGVSFCYVTEGDGEDASAAGGGEASPSSDTAGSEDDQAQPPATDTLEPGPSPLGSVALVSGGISLVGLGLVALRQRGAVRRR
jgi:hypothetical protein